MIIILEQLLILYAFLCIGWGFGKFSPTKTSHTQILSFLLVNLFLPCKIFTAFSKNFTPAYIKANYITLIFSLCILILLVLVGIPIAKKLTKNVYEQKVFRYSLIIANYSYMGYALIEALLGPVALTNFIFYCIPFQIYTYSFGYSMLTGGENPAKKLINPVSVSIILGMFFGVFAIDIPGVFEKIISYSSACTAPISMLLTGLTLSAFSVKELIFDKKTYVLSALRLLVIPLAVFGICQLLSLFIELPASIYPMGVIMAAMPCGLNSVVFPKLIGEDCKPGARLAFITHIFSILTLSMWLYLLL